MLSSLRFSPANPARRSLGWVFLLLMALPWLAQAQCPPGDVSLSTQDEVNAFPPGCTNLTRELVITGENITNLNGLKNLQTVGRLQIADNPRLTSIAALTALTSVGETVAIFNNAVLTSLNGLNQLQTVGRGTVLIADNPRLTSIAALTALTSVGDDVDIDNNAVLTSLQGLNKLQTVGGTLLIADNLRLTSIAALTALTSVGDDVDIDNNAVLTSLQGLNQLQTVNRSLRIANNPQLTSIAALTALTSVGDNAVINNNAVLPSLDGLNKLQTVGRTLLIERNSRLTSIAALTALTTVSSDLEINNNAVLPSLDGLNQLQTVNRILQIQANPQLAVCALSSICQLVATKNSLDIAIAGNAPGCSSVEQVQANCLSITTQPAAGATVCAGSSVTATVTASGSGITYRWYRGSQPVSNQTTATLSLTNVQAGDAGAYVVVVSNSVSSLTSTAFSLTVNLSPVPFTVTGGGSYCAGGTGAAVGLSGSQTGATYQLLRAGNPAGNPVAGTGNALSFGNQTTLGTYTVRATTTSTPCAQTMNGEATVTTTAQPSVSLSNDGPLTCAKPQVTLTASSATSGTFVFGGPGLSQSATANTATVSQEGLYSVTLTAAGGCSASAATTVASNTTVAAPTLQASATPTTNQPISVTASGCQGTVNWRPQGGTGQANGAVYTFSQPGNYTLSATCSVGNCSSAPADPLSLSIRPGGLAITSVSMVSCQLFDAAKGEYQVRFTPQYSGSNGQPITFAVVNELAPTTQPAPYQLRLYADNPTITLVANQPANNQARFAYEWLASCRSGGQANQPPTTSGIPNQTLLQDQPYQLALTDYFADPDAQPLTFSASGLPPGLSLSGSLISGRPSATGVSQVNITALDPGGLQVSTRFSLTVTPRPTTPTGFTITGVSLVSCEGAGPNRRQLRFTPQYAGTDNAPISFWVVNELSPTTDAGPYTLLLYTDNPAITLSAQQGSAQASFRYDWLQACAGGARVGAEPGSGLQVRVLGNPASGSQVSVEVRGAQGQPLRVQLTDAAGRAVSERLMERAGAVERQTLSLGNQPTGILLLRVSTPTQSQTLKLLKAE